MKLTVESNLHNQDKHEQIPVISCFNEIRITNHRQSPVPSKNSNVFWDQGAEQENRFAKK